MMTTAALVETTGDDAAALPLVLGAPPWPTGVTEREAGSQRERRSVVVVMSSRWWLRRPRIGQAVGTSVAGERQSRRATRHDISINLLRKIHPGVDIFPGTKQPRNQQLNMNAVEKKLKKKLESQKTSSLSARSKEALEHLSPPKMHRNMRLICDCFRISEETRYALRSFDASTLDDFSLMTDEDFADLIVRMACIGKPLPPLQQRKVSVLLSWARSLPAIEPEEIEEVSNKAEGFELAERWGGNDNDGVLKARYKASPRNGDSALPASWEVQFYRDLPRLRAELREMGRRRPFSNWATEFLSLRWVFCG